MTLFRSLNVLIAAALAAPLTLGAWTAMAQDRPGPGPAGEPRESRMLRMLDTDDSGGITMDEITAEHGRLVVASDVDGDGALSVDEFRRRGHLFQSLATTTLFDLIDADGDGLLTPAELNAPSERWFGRYDANGDGVMDGDELPQRGDGRRGRR
ncbi:MAG: EF-hand domain-containing protein [Inquilinaceae bacterium]